jgi:predicted nucleotide-binding protein (sugar kinase/HSP70/actin superfamily)
MHSAATTNEKRKLPLTTVSSHTLGIDDEMRNFETELRSRLGYAPKPNPWLETMSNLKFLRSERATVTILLGGLTVAHDRLVEGAFRGLGYNIMALACPDQDALRVGKEFGNRGQCNPTYFTVGNLVKYLQELEATGLSRKDIVQRYVFLTAGACGPCRFGMYVTEYRKALRDAGFDGFRVVAFQQQGGLSQVNGEDVGLEMSPKFFGAMLQALGAGDAINALAYRIRPYETVVGATNDAVAKATERCYQALLQRRSVLRALLGSRKYFGTIEVDRTRIKPKVAIIGEFWAMTTEGDGNYHLQKFIEQEGGEVDIQIVTAWLLYNIWEVRFDTNNRADLRGTDSAPQGLAGVGEFGVAKRKLLLTLAEKALRAGFFAYSRALGLYDYHLPNMDQVAEVARDYYNNDVRGGEGHMEIGKVILNAVGKKSTMTLSVKPFGCMPSSGVSDGVQSLIQEKYPGNIFCAVETSGDGAVNFQSRVQMYLHKAKRAAAEELDRALAETGLTLERVSELAQQNQRWRRALTRPKHRGTTTAVDLVYAAAEQLNSGASRSVAKRAIWSSMAARLRSASWTPPRVHGLADNLQSR